MALVAFSLLLSGAVLWHVEFEAFASAFTAIGLGEFAVLIGLFLVVITIAALRLFCFIHYFTDASIPYLVALRACIAGLLSSLVVINLVGNIAGRQLILMESGVPVSTTAATALLERVLMACLGGVLLLVGWGRLFSGASLWSDLQRMALPEIVFCIFVTPVLTTVIFRWGREIQLMKEMISKAFAARLATLIAVTTLGQLLTISSFVVAGLAFDLGLDVGSLLAAGAVISFAAALPISVNGWGVRELTAVFVLGQLGVPSPAALALSVTVGLASTAAVLLVGPLLGLRAGRTTGDFTSAAGPPAATSEMSTVSATKMLGERRVIKCLVMALGPATAILLFYRMHVEFGETLVSINLADPFAVFGLVLVGSLALYRRRLILDLPRPFVIWIAAVTFSLLLSFLIGVADFGVTNWALNNRLVGWFVLLGYGSIGALWVSVFRMYGLRRLTETLMVAGAVVVVVTVGHYELGIPMYQDRPLWNLEGFSLNRNGFAFELAITLASALAFSPVVARLGRYLLFSLLGGIIMFAIWRTYSNTGVITMAALLLTMFALKLSDRRVTAYMVLAGIGVFGCVFLAHTLWDVAFGLAGGSSFSSNFYFQPGIGRPSFYLGTSLAERWATIERGFEMWQENPLLGAGLGAFINLGLRAGGEQLVIHSTPIWMLAEFGLIGTAILISLPLVFCAKLLCNPSQLRARPNNLLFGIFFCFALFSLPHDIVYQRIFWFILGAAAAAYAGRNQTVAAHV